MMKCEHFFLDEIDSHVRAPKLKRVCVCWLVLVVGINVARR